MYPLTDARTWFAATQRGLNHRPAAVSSASAEKYDASRLGCGGLDIRRDSSVLVLWFSG